MVVVAVVDAAVVMAEDGGNVDAIGAGHAVVAVVAGHEGILHDVVGSIKEHLHFFFAQRLEGRKGTQVILEMFHVGHSR